MLRTSRFLNVSMKITFVLACTAVVISALLDIYERIQTPEAAKPAVPSAFRPGAKAPTILGVDFASSTRTLLIFVSTHCSHCEKSSPFYDRLAKAAERAAKSHGRLRVVAVFPQTAEDVDLFKARMTVNIESIAGVPLDTVGVTATPTVLLVSQSGTVTRAWVGSEGKQTQNAIYSAFFTGS